MREQQALLLIIGLELDGASQERDCRFWIRALFQV